MDVVQVQGLEKSYKELRVLRGVDLDVPTTSWRAAQARLDELDADPPG